MSYQIVPTWDNGAWTETPFNTRKEFTDFLLPLFKEPGKYEFDQTSLLFNEQARLYNQNGKLFCLSPLKTKDYINYWDDQARKCRNGVLFKSGANTWYLPRDYYMWINFLPIYDKVKKKYDFPNVWDTQYHRALYETLAELHYKHVAELKKRQIASSYMRCAKLINQLWFEEGAVMKIGASHKDYISEKGSWRFLNEYKSFLNEHTAWYRPMTPDKVLMWQQQIEVTKGKRKSMNGFKGTIQGITFDKDPTNGVGGAIKYFFYEEAGIAPTMDTTVEYLFPAMKMGEIYTGMFIAAGSVGDLEQCEPLKKMILKPEVNDIYPVHSNLIDDKGTIGLTGLFIPEQWSMPPYIDLYGNSLVEQALNALNKQFAIWKKDLPAETYQLRISQQPRNIQEAFAWRKVSVYPMHLVNAQIKRIEDKEYPCEFINLRRDATGKVESVPSHKLPIKDWPIDMKMEDKEGVITVWERPVPSPDFGHYYASIDPVAEGKTTSSESLNSIYILKKALQVTKITAGEPKTFIEPEKIVCSWAGRFDDPNDNYRRMEMMVEWYNAWTIIENNWTGFIQYMQAERKQKYLAHKEDMVFLKEHQLSQNVYQDYGWKNSGRVFKDNIQPYGIDYLSEVLDRVTKEDGTIVKTIYGVERIPDQMLLKEMAGYEDGKNVDRIVAFSALVAFSRVQDSHRGLRKKIIDDGKDKTKEKNPYIIHKSPFHNMGSQSSNNPMRPSRNPFRNLK